MDKHPSASMGFYMRMTTGFLKAIVAPNPSAKERRGVFNR